MNFNKYACALNKLNEIALDGSDTALLKTAFFTKREVKGLMPYLHKPLHVGR